MNRLCPFNYGVEDSEHQFLLCYMCDDIRHDLLNDVNAILLPNGMANLSNDEFVNIHLYDHENLPFELTIEIFKATLD